MSLEKDIADIVRSVMREELARAADLNDIRLLTAEQTADLLAFTDVHSIYRLKREGELHPIMLADRTLRFRYSDVRRYIERKAGATDLTRESLEPENPAPIVRIGRANTK